MIREQCSTVKRPWLGHLVVIGVGLIGGSVSLALKQAGAVERVTGVGRSRENLELAVQLGVVDQWSHDIAAAVSDADMVLLAVPMNAYDEVFAAIRDHLPATAVVTDVGSTKQSAIVAAARVLKHPQRFVAAHPIAGTEASGAGAAFATLFENRLCIITPAAEGDSDAVAMVRRLWEQVGSRVEVMGAVEHDGLLAAVSHLPHLAAFALVNAVSKQKQDGHDPFHFAAGGFRDFTRIASSSPEMWRDIALCNQQALLEQIDRYQQELQGLKQALEEGDGDRLLEEFSTARAARQNWLRSL